MENIKFNKAPGFLFPSASARISSLCHTPAALTPHPPRKIIWYPMNTEPYRCTDKTN